MSEDTNTERLRALAHQLIGLLDADEVGLHTWHEAVHKKIDEIGNFSSYKSAMVDAYDILDKISVPGAQEWVQKVERLCLL